MAKIKKPRKVGVAKASGVLHSTALLAGNRFGSAVSSSDKLLAVGSYASDQEDAIDAGHVEVFEWDGLEYKLKELIVDDNFKALDYFGNSVAISKTFLIVGAFLNSDEAAYAGKVVIYKIDADGKYIKLQELRPETSLEDNKFGNSVAIHGKTLLIGSVGDETVKHYEFNGNTDSFDLIATLSKPADTTFNNFGASIALTDDYLIISAADVVSENPDGGAVFIYKLEKDNYEKAKNGKVTSLLNMDPMFTLLPNEAGKDNFGISVALDGDVLAVSSFLDIDGLVDAGGVYFYKITGEVVTPFDLIIADTPIVDDYFGWSISLNKGVLYSGVLQHTIDAVEDAGALCFNPVPTEITPDEPKGKIPFPFDRLPIPYDLLPTPKEVVNSYKEASKEERIAATKEIRDEVKEEAVERDVTYKKVKRLIQIMPVRGLFKKSISEIIEVYPITKEYKNDILEFFNTIPFYKIPAINERIGDDSKVERFADFLEYFNIDGSLTFEDIYNAKISDRDCAPVLTGMKEFMRLTISKKTRPDAQYELYLILLSVFNNDDKDLFLKQMTLLLTIFKVEEKEAFDGVSLVSLDMDWRHGGDKRANYKFMVNYLTSACDKTREDFDAKFSTRDLGMNFTKQSVYNLIYFFNH